MDYTQSTLRMPSEAEHSSHSGLVKSPRSAHYPRVDKNNNRNNNSNDSNTSSDNGREKAAVKRSTPTHPASATQKPPKSVSAHPRSSPSPHLSQPATPPRSSVTTQQQQSPVEDSTLRRPFLTTAASPLIPVTAQSPNRWNTPPPEAPQLPPPTRASVFAGSPVGGRPWRLGSSSLHRWDSSFVASPTLMNSSRADTSYASSGRASSVVFTNMENGQSTAHPARRSRAASALGLPQERLRRESERAAIDELSQSEASRSALRSPAARHSSVASPSSFVASPFAPSSSPLRAFSNKSLYVRPRPASVSASSSSSSSFSSSSIAVTSGTLRSTYSTEALERDAARLTSARSPISTTSQQLDSARGGRAGRGSPNNTTNASTSRSRRRRPTNSPRPFRNVQVADVETFSLEAAAGSESAESADPPTERRTSKTYLNSTVAAPLIARAAEVMHDTAHQEGTLQGGMEDGAEVRDAFLVPKRRESYSTSENDNENLLSGDEAEMEADGAFEGLPLTPQAAAGAAGIEIGPAAGEWNLPRIQQRILAARTQAVTFQHYTSAMEILLAVQMSLDVDYQEASAMSAEDVNGSSLTLTPEQRAYYADLVGRELQYVTALWMAKLQAGDARAASPLLTPRRSVSPSSPARSSSAASWHRSSSSAHYASIVATGASLSQNVSAMSTSRSASVGHQRRRSHRQRRTESAHTLSRQSTEQTEQRTHSTTHKNTKTSSELSEMRGGPHELSSRGKRAPRDASSETQPSATHPTSRAAARVSAENLTDRQGIAHSTYTSATHTNVSTTESTSTLQRAAAHANRATEREVTYDNEREEEETEAATSQLSSLHDDATPSYFLSSHDATSRDTQASTVAAAGATRAKRPQRVTEGGRSQEGRPTRRKQRSGTPIRRRHYKIDAVDMDSDLVHELSTMLDDTVLGLLTHGPFESDYRSRSRRPTAVGMTYDSGPSGMPTATFYYPSGAVVYSSQDRRMSLLYGVPRDGHGTRSSVSGSAGGSGGGAFSTGNGGLMRRRSSAASNGGSTSSRNNHSGSGILNYGRRRGTSRFLHRIDWQRGSRHYTYSTSEEKREADARETEAAADLQQVRRPSTHHDLPEEHRPPPLVIPGPSSQYGFLEPRRRSSASQTEEGENLPHTAAACSSSPSVHPNTPSNFASTASSPPPSRSGSSRHTLNAASTATYNTEAEQSAMTMATLTTHTTTATNTRDVRDARHDEGSSWSAHAAERRLSRSRGSADREGSPMQASPHRSRAVFKRSPTHTTATPTDSEDFGKVNVSTDSSRRPSNSASSQTIHGDGETRGAERETEQINYSSARSRQAHDQRAEELQQQYQQALERDLHRMQYSPLQTRSSPLWQPYDEHQEASASLSQSAGSPLNTIFSPPLNDNAKGNVVRLTRPNSASPVKAAARPPISPRTARAGVANGRPPYAPRQQSPSRFPQKLNSPPTSPQQRQQGHYLRGPADPLAPPRPPLITSPFRAFTTQVTTTTETAEAAWHSSSSISSDTSHEGDVAQARNWGEASAGAHASHRESRPFLTPPSSPSLSATTATTLTQQTEQVGGEAAHKRASSTKYMYEYKLIYDSEGNPRRRLTLRRARGQSRDSFAMPRSSSSRLSRDETFLQTTSRLLNGNTSAAPLPEPSALQIENESSHSPSVKTAADDDKPFVSFTQYLFKDKRRTTIKSVDSIPDASPEVRSSTPSSTDSTELSSSDSWFSRDIQKKHTIEKEYTQQSHNKSRHLKDSSAHPPSTIRRSTGTQVSPAASAPQPELEAHVSDDEHAEPTHAARKSVAMAGAESNASSQPELEAHVSDDEHAEPTHAARKSVAMPRVYCDDANLATLKPSKSRLMLLRRMRWKMEREASPSASRQSSVVYDLSTGVSSESDVRESVNEFIYSGDVAQWWLDEEGSHVGDYYNTYRNVVSGSEATDLKWCGRPVHNLRLSDRASATYSGTVPYTDGSKLESQTNNAVYEFGQGAYRPRPPTAPSGNVRAESLLSEATGDASLSATLVAPRDQLRSRRLEQQRDSTAFAAHTAEGRLVLRDVPDNGFAGTNWRDGDRPRSDETRNALWFLRHGTAESDVLALTRRSNAPSLRPSRPATGKAMTRSAAVRSDNSVGSGPPSFSARYPSLSRPYSALSAGKRLPHSAVPAGAPGDAQPTQRDVPAAAARKSEDVKYSEH